MRTGSTLRVRDFLSPPSIAMQTEGISVGLKDDSDLFVWEVLVVGPPDTLYEGGFFKAELVFPPEFPNMPVDPDASGWT